MQNSSPVALGQIIAGKYQIEGVLGEGGMGIVVSAWHLGLEQRVAIKLLLSHMRHADSSALERFQREARAAARIQSEHVCRVLDTGHLDDGTPFLVMEYLEGADLADELVRRGRFPVAEAARYVCEACTALTQAHQAGVIHRDLKPANLFLVQRSDGARLVKVLDFGVSKSVSSTGAPHLTLTKTSSLVGSPIYMSPEQLNSSKDVDGRTDIWALGVILYELIAGRTPFYGESIAQLVNAVLNTEPESFAAQGLEVPAGLEQVVRKALAKSRDARFATAKELHAALAPFADRPSVAPAGSVKGPLPTRSMSASDAPRVSVSSPTPVNTQKKRGGLRIALIGLLIVAIAGLAALLSRRGGDAGAEAEPEPGSLPAVDSASMGSSPSTASPDAPLVDTAQPSAAPIETAQPAPAPTGALAPAPDAESPSVPERAASSARPEASEKGEAPEREPPRRAVPARSSEPTRPARERTHHAPAATPAVKTEVPDDGLPNFGGRR